MGSLLSERDLFCMCFDLDVSLGSYSVRLCAKYLVRDVSPPSLNTGFS